jgi:hypothetical protein
MAKYNHVEKNEDNDDDDDDIATHVPRTFECSDVRMFNYGSYNDVMYIYIYIYYYIYVYKRDI